MRHKGDNVGIRTMDELEDAIREIGALDRDIRANTDEMNAEIDEIKARYKAMHDELAENRQGRLLRVQAYVEPRRDELLGKKKTKRLNFGKVGWRKLPDKIELPKRRSNGMWDLVTCVISMQAESPAVFSGIGIHRDEWVTVGDLKKLSDEALADLNLTRTPGGDEFFVEPDEEKLETLETPLEAA